MTYLVLARKWRPRSFDTLIGQDHVVRALTHALSSQRLHHAWLFTGTRGVGKTTLSRILAKSLNCEQGITPSPCGVCRACTEIDSGRFVDYIELDAASNRGVDEMTQLLEQAVYAPSSGRFKVYMIDEVHMLTGHAFNAMLKTLEEPPPHVKFILATTDPQKIPVTVLSRCLQFNLKQMAADAIVGHLQMVLGQEDIAFETPALRLIAQAASGSMRDALSLTDQAIAYSAGQLTTDAIQGMLGTIDQRYLLRLLQALADGSASEVLVVADELATRGLSYSGALADLAVLLSRVAIEQRIPGSVPADDPMAEDIAALAQRMPPDFVQLFYSVAVHSRHELSLAPDEYAGFVMACLRMLALVPRAVPPDSGRADAPAAQAREQLQAPHQVQAQAQVQAQVQAQAQVQEPAQGQENIPAQENARAQAGQAEPVQEQRAEDAAPSTGGPVSSAPLAGSPRRDQAAVAVGKPAMPQAPEAAVDVPAWEDIPIDESAGQYEPYDERQPFTADGDDEAFESMSAAAADIPMPAFEPAGKKPKSPRLRDMTATTWPALAARLPLTGLAAELARQSEWLGVNGDEINLRVAIRTLAESAGQARLCTLLSEYFGTVVHLNVEYGATGDDTAHAVAQAEQARRQHEAEQAVQVDPFVQTLISDFGAVVVPGSVRPAPVDKAA
ncbi:MAG TPA: DNA polymerase III subunit gamma/tau [Eoetvoesiella sp.]|uniref:DNA polymerase III subunit gamma/tau n=1 Tax=Eoetvoesiella sp. TaxID=1966355 RepID=UPI002B8B644A|nr:DNA polymerase III subunit gamma/tau [Eoetvoesiella sp.]HWK60718.1 DNA polymerase III subunit gamma/tau [Eoetvoesiella sp.]